MPVSPPASPPSPTSHARKLERRFLGIITARLPLKLAALFFALVLWFMVGAEEPTQEWVDVRLALVMDSTVTVRDSLPHVQALVVGRARQLLKLYTELPVIRHVVGANTPDEVTLDLHPEDVILPGDVSARVTDIRPRSVLLSFVVTMARKVPVHTALRIVADSGLRITGGPSVEPDSVLVRGPRAAVRGLGSVPTERVRFLVHDTIATHIVRLDTIGLGVTVDPTAVRVRVLAVRDTTRPGTSDTLFTRPTSP